VITLDDLDYRIIRLLQLDARTSSREMASHLGDISDRVVATASIGSSGAASS